MTDGLSLHFQEIWPESGLNWSLPVSSGISSLKPAKTHTGAFPGSSRSQLDRKPSVVQTSWQSSRRGLTGRRLPSGLRWSPGTTAGTGALNPWAQQRPPSQASGSALTGARRSPTAPGELTPPPTAAAWPHRPPPLPAEPALLFLWIQLEAWSWVPIGQCQSWCPGMEHTDWPGPGHVTILAKTRVSCSRSVRDGESAMPPEQGWESGHSVRVFSVLGHAWTSSLHTTLSPLQTKYSWHTFSLPKRCFTHWHSREQDLLLEGRFGDPLLNSGLVPCIVLE